MLCLEPLCFIELERAEGASWTEVLCCPLVFREPDLVIRKLFPVAEIGVGCDVFD